MLWVLVLHICALLLWCAALLYLPVLVAGLHARRADMDESLALRRPFNTLERFVFTHLATPAALVTIMSGTLVFVLNRSVDAWLMVKLTLVVGLVVCHTLVGLLVLRAEMPDVASARMGLWCGVLEVVLSVLMLGILWVVLSKSSVAWLS